MTKQQILKCFVVYEANTPNGHYRIPVRIFQAAIKSLCETYENEISQLKNQCENCACAKFADNAIKPSMGISLWNALKQVENNLGDIEK